MLLKRNRIQSKEKKSQIQTKAIQVKDKNLINLN